MRRVLIVLSAFAISIPLFSMTRPAHAGSSLSSTKPSKAAAVPSIDLLPVLTDLDQPLYVTGARDGTNRLFVAEKPGRIKVLQPGATAPTVFLDISQMVMTEDERGLAGLVFHPQFSDNHRFFISYVRAPDGATVIAEYHTSADDPNVADTEEKQLLVIPQISSIHHSGMLAFGPDGYLYISTGDSEQFDPGNNAQNIDTLLGKLLRIDVDHPDGDTPYSSPPDNPFFGPKDGRDEIYAYGFRNPWRFSIDRETGQIYVGDVGLDSREEIDLITAGGNYGWHVFEGTLCTGFEADLCSSLLTIPPIAEYSHSDMRCAVTGGYVYRGAAGSLPVGTYIFGDFCTGEIFMLNDGQQQILLDTDRSIDSFGEDDNNEIYVVGIGGTVDRIVSATSAVPPFQIDTVQVRKHSGGKVISPVTVKPNGKKFDLVVQGTSFATGAVIVADGHELETTVGATDTELIARMRGNMLAQRGTLTVQVVNPDGTHSNSFTVTIQ
jgi:glucose/arabinose dehydrogenase